MTNQGAGRRLLRDKRIYIAVILISVWVIGSVVARPFYDRLNDDDGNDDAPPAQGRNYVELAPLVQDATRIVIATFVEEVEPGAATPAAGSNLVGRRFTVVESLRGGGVAGESIEVWSDAGTGVDSLLDLEAGTDYVLFLAERDVDGVTRWSPPGEPFVASVADDGTLEFVVSDRYASDMRRLGWTTGEERVPFTATLDGIRAAIVATPAPGTTATP